MKVENFVDIAWNNKSYSISLKSQILKEEKLIKFRSPFEKNIGKNFIHLPKNRIYLLGYDVSNTLHLGSLIPLLNILTLLKENKDNELVISINDIESTCSRKIEWNKIENNILRLKSTFIKIINKFNSLYRTNIHLIFVIRSKKTEIWKYLADIITLPHIEKLFAKYYGNIPIRHLISILVMVSEFFRVSEKRQIITSYGYEELIHLKFINELFILKKKKPLNFILFLPLTSPFDNTKKMSKSEDITALSLIKNKKYLQDMSFKLSKKSYHKKEDLLRFWNYWSFLFKEDRNYSDLRIVKLLKEFGS